MRTRIGAVVVAALVLFSCGGKETTVKYDFPTDTTVPTGDASAGVDLPGAADHQKPPLEYRYRIKLIEDTTKPLQVIVGDHPSIQAWVVDFDSNTPAVNYPVQYEILASDPECNEHPPCARFMVKEASTDADGNVWVTFEAGEQGGVLYDVRVSGDDALTDSMEIMVNDPPTGDIRLALEYFGPIAIHGINIRLMHGFVSCSEFNPVNPWTEVDQQKTVSGIDSTPLFSGLPLDESYLLFATALGPTEHLTAEGCTDAIHVLPIENGETKVTLELDPVILNPAGTYDMVSKFDFTDAIPGQAGEIIDLIVTVFTDPGDIIIDLVKELVKQYIGELITDLAFSLFEDMLSDIISDWLLNNSPDFIQDFFVIGQDLVQIVNNVTLTSELKISKLSGDYYIQGIQSWQGIILYWKLGCDPDDPDYEDCGAYPFSLQDLQDSDVPINLITGQFNGMVANVDQLIIDKHIVELNYGALILFVINEMLLPAVSDYNSIEDLLYSIVDCPSIADAFDNSILDAIGIDEGDLEGFCNQAVTLLVSPIEEMIMNLALDSKMRMHGKCTMVDENDDLYVDTLIEGEWWGHIEIQSEEGSEFSGTFEAEKAEMPE